MTTLRALILLALAGGLVPLVQADTLQMGANDRAATFEAPGKPKRGMSKASVEAEFGQPASTRAAVGDPPITRWDYPGFAVFFEYDRVIHAVSK